MSYLLHCNIKPHRKRSHLLQREIAFLLGLDAASGISRVERGQREPDLRTALGYQVVFDQVVHDLFPGVYDEVRLDVSQRAHALASRLKQGPQSALTAFKLRRLESLSQYADAETLPLWSQ